MSTQAFPGVTATGYNDGMTLLDYFAAQALKVLPVADKRYMVGPEKGKIAVGTLAWDAYDIAEALIKERDRRKGEPATTQDMLHSMARQGWFRALVTYVDIDAEGDPEYIKAADARWPL